MKVYYAGTSKNHKIMVQPGIDHPEISDWFYPDGKSKMLTVQFIDGVAEVEDNLGQYLIDKKLAQKSFLILPAEVA